MSGNEKKALFDKAFTRALIEMGDDAKNLSCLYPNWKNFSGAQSSDEDSRKAPLAA